VTRGRANTLRLAISGQLGPDALLSDEMAETLKLCVSCKACRRECPTGVDMAKMKSEILHQRGKAKGFSAKDRLIAELPRYASKAARVGGLLALRDRLPGAAALSQKLFGFAAERSLPAFRKDWFRDEEGTVPPRAESADDAPTGVVLFADTFGRWFDPQTLRAAVKVLAAAGYSVETASAPSGPKRPLCCGRTYLASGMADRAKEEASRTIEALRPHLEAGKVVVGLEPSCILTFRDEFPALVPGEDARRLAARSFLFEEFLAAEAKAGRLSLPFDEAPRKVMLHGHCHQKAFGAMPAVEAALRLVPGLDLTVIESSCCGMAGAFGYDAQTIDVSRAMGELSLLPAVRAAPADTILAADGTSCRHQIADGSGREARHVAQILADALKEDEPA
jgi:Fe-S oxidoreductase